MRRIAAVGILAVLLSIGMVVQAQTPEPAVPAFPDPAEVFHEGVEWSVIEPEAPPVWPVQIDHNMGSYQQPPTVCDDRVIQAEPGKGAWTVVYPDDNFITAYLCHSESGERRDVLPNGLTDWRVHSSLNATWLVLIARNWREGGDFQVFAYQEADNQLTHLGSVSRGIDNEVSICDWVTEMQGLLCTSPYHGWEGFSYYTFDLEQPDSITYAFGGWRDNLFRIEDPLRYVSVFSLDFSAAITGSRGNQEPCTLTIFDADGVRHHELGYECIPVMEDYLDYRSPYYRHGNTIYYLTVDSPDSTVSSLSSYDTDLETGNYPLFNGEIESIISVSPSGQYIVLLLGDDGMLNFPWRPYQCCSDTDGWRVAVLDRDSERIAYLSEPIRVYAANEVIWLDDITLIVGARERREFIRVSEHKEDVNRYAIPASLRRINFEENAVTTTITTQYGLEWNSQELNVSPDRNYLLRDDNTVIDLRTFEEIPVLRGDVPEGFSVGVRWLEDGDLQVAVFVIDDYREAVTYRVTLPR